MQDSSSQPPSLSIKAFRAEGILGGTTYHLNVGQTATIIVGPNGTGKSTFLNLFYLFLSRQWTRLAEYDFVRLTLFHEGGEVSITREDILTLDALPRAPVRIKNYFNILSQNNQLDIIFKNSMTKAERETISNTLKIGPIEVSSLSRFVNREIGASKAAITADNYIKSLNIGRILYMPTYRRIEKDIRSIFPDIEDRLRDRFIASNISGREDDNFKEIVSFGMSDVEKIIRDFISSVKDYQRVSTETASQEYIRDIVRGRISSYSLRGIRELNDEVVLDFIERLDVNLFTQNDREELTKKIEKLRQRTPGQPNKDMRYLGFYVEKLLAAHTQVTMQEQPLLDFGRNVASYLGNNKRVIFKNLEFKIVDSITGAPITLDQLSSGEKQIISIFAYLLLKKDSNYILFIDEPELSLSVPWQKKFLPDILETGSCKNLFSVTHSPFVFDNDLKKSVIDVARLGSHHG